MEKHSSQSRSLANVHPSEILKKDWIVSSQSVYADGLIVQHQIEAADEVELPPVTHHLISLILHTTSSRQLSRFSGCEYEGSQMNGGQFWLWPVGSPAQFVWDGTDETMLFMLDPSLLRRIAAETKCRRADRIELLPTIIGHDAQLEFIASAFHRDIQCGGMGGQIYTESLANLFTIHLLQHYCNTTSIPYNYEDGLSQRQIQPVLDYIQAHLDQNISLNELAGLAGMNVHTFWKSFKRSLGMPPHQYVIHCRIDRAKILLMRHKAMAIADIALQCGFTDQSHLNRHFRKYVGVSPRSYRHQ